MCTQIEIHECVPGTHTQTHTHTHTHLNFFISVQVLCVGGQVILTGICLCVCFACVYMRSLTLPPSQTDLACFAADRCGLLTGSESDERRGCSLKFRYLPLDSSVDPLCCGSSCTMSHQLTGLMGRDSQREKKKNFPQSDCILRSLLCCFS